MWTTHGPTIVKLTAAGIALLIVALAFRRALLIAVAGVARWIASKLKRPNPNATWQDAYAPRCTRCGYDLRASPIECPECGEPVPAYERTIIHYLIKIGDDPHK